MTAAAALLAYLHSQGVALRRDGDALCYKPKRAVDAAMRALLSRHRRELLGLLPTEPAKPTGEEQTPEFLTADKTPDRVSPVRVSSSEEELHSLFAAVSGTAKRAGLRQQYDEDVAVAVADGLPKPHAERLALHEIRLAVAGLPRGLDVPLMDHVLSVFGPRTRAATPRECEQLGDFGAEG